MPLPNKKPKLNTVINLVMPHGKSKSGKWDGSHWWIEVQVGGPWIPLKDTFVKEWKDKV